MMGYNQPNCFVKTWWTIKYAVGSWLEWMDAKCWAKTVHPAWLEMATKCRKSETREYYKRKILMGYRGTEND